MNKGHNKFMRDSADFFEDQERHKPRRPRKANATVGSFRGTPPKIQKPRKKR